MKRILLCFCLAGFVVACNNNKSEPAKENSDSGKTMIDLPYKASFSSNFTNNVSDSDLLAVLMSYKYWENGDMSGLSKTMADTVSVDMASGEHFVVSNADLMKRWNTYRDSLKSVSINMQAWQKMYEPDKKLAFVVTWYEEYDTFKSGKVDSAYFHDINQIKNGKIPYYEQYRRPAAKQ